MSTHPRRLAGCFLIGLLVQAPSLPADPVLPPCPPGLIEGPDPIGRSCIVDPKTTSNSSTRPELGHDPATGSPFMLWADGRIGGRDIAFAVWNDGGWSAPEYVASTPADERDPRVFVAADGTILVTWWAEGRDAGVYCAMREPLAGDWSPAVRVTASGRSPSIALVSGRILVVFERGRSNGAVELVSAWESSAGTWTEQAVCDAVGSGSLDNRVRHERGRTWVEWTASPTELAWSEWTAGRWSPRGTIPVDGSAWKAGQEAREKIREIVFAH